MNESKWFDDYDNVTRLGYWLTYTKEFTGEQLQGYYGKPFNWTDEWNEMLAEEAEERREAAEAKANQEVAKELAKSRR